MATKETKSREDCYSIHVLRQRLRARPRTMFQISRRSRPAPGRHPKRRSRPTGRLPGNPSREEPAPAAGGRHERERLLGQGRRPFDTGEWERVWEPAWDGATEGERSRYEVRVEYNTGTESNSERDSNAKHKTPEEEAGARTGDLSSRTMKSGTVTVMMKKSGVNSPATARMTAGSTPNG